MICVCIAEKSAESIVAALDRLDFAEVRLDAIEEPAQVVRNLFSHPSAKVATMGAWSESNDRSELLEAAIEGGAEFADIDLATSPQVLARSISIAKQHRCQVIVSHHDFERTPDATTLDAIVNRCFDAGANIAKIACLVHGSDDCERLLALLVRHSNVLPVTMGDQGKAARLLALMRGVPFMYASYAPGKETAPGQIDHVTMRRLLHGLQRG